MRWRPEALVPWAFEGRCFGATGAPEASIMAKLMTMKDAIASFVRDGDLVVMEGFTHLIPFAAGHEIIRQRKRDLTLARLTPDLIYDQLIFAGCVRKMIFSWAGNPGVGPLHAFRRAVEQGKPGPLEIEEYTHFGMVLRFMAGGADPPVPPAPKHPAPHPNR